MPNSKLGLGGAHLRARGERISPNPKEVILVGFALLAIIARVPSTVARRRLCPADRKGLILSTSLNLGCTMEKKLEAATAVCTSAMLLY